MFISFCDVGEAMILKVLIPIFMVWNGLNLMFFNELAIPLCIVSFFTLATVTCFYLYKRYQREDEIKRKIYNNIK